MATRTICRRAVVWGMCLVVLSCTNPAGGESDPAGGDTVETFSVSYAQNGATSGAVPVDSNSYSSGDEVTVLGNTGALARSGYAFAHWNTAADGSGAGYSAGDTFTIDGADVVLHADWRASGSLDSDFDPGTGANDVIGAVELQSDGKILIAGQFTSYDGTGRNGIARLNPDGSLDTSFDPGTGITGGSSPAIYRMLVDSNGKILIAGDFTTYNGTSRVRIARLNSDGSLDETFQPGAGANDSVLAMALQSDGKIVIGGEFTSYDGADGDYVTRGETDGDLDTTFAPDPEGAGNTVRDIAVQSDGKLVIVGSFLSYEDVSRGFIARIDPVDGGLDTTFDPSSGANNVVYSVAAQEDGKLLIGGLFAAFNGTLIDKLARIDSGGTIDGTFDPSDGPSNSVSKIVPLGGNDLLIGGQFKAYDGNTVHGIVRVDSNGSRDTSFAPDPGTNASNPLVVDIEQPGNQRIIIVGAFTSYNGINRGRIARIWH